MVDVRFSNNDKDLEAFIRLYNLTMNRLQAKSYYYFNNNYFFNLKYLFPKNFLLAGAYAGNELLASGIILCFDQIMNYHLSCSNWEKHYLAPNNLLDFEIANYGAKNGFKFLQLGGGRAPNDSLFQYKKSFSPNSLKEFWTGEKIHLTDEYDSLSHLRKKTIEDINTPNRISEIFPFYRS